MATTTPRIGLTKPDGTDLVDIAVLNTNFDKIDSNIASTKIQSTKPSTANAGDLWWDSDTGTLYLYYTDANSSQWVAATSDPVNIGVVANQTERDAQYPTPAQGMSVYRTDLGVTQRYYGLFNISTNPGGRDSAGWYDTEKSAGLVPIKASNITTVSGTATFDSLGKITVTGATILAIDGVFTSKYKSYRIIVEQAIASAGTGNWVAMRLRGAGSNNESTNYYAGGFYAQGTSLTNYSAVGNSYWESLFVHSANGWGYAVIDISNPAAATATNFHGQLSGFSGAGANFNQVTGGFHNVAASYDGFSLLSLSGAFSAVVSIYGVN